MIDAIDQFDSFTMRHEFGGQNTSKDANTA